MSPDEKDQALKAVSQLKLGDLILIKTPNTTYELMRKIYNSPYDHIVVVVDQERCLHISYPRAKLVPSYLFTHSVREPLVIRPNLSDQ